MSIRWQTKKMPFVPRGIADVRLSLTKTKAGRTLARVTFLDGIAKVFKGKHVELGFDQGKVYFRATHDFTVGYSLSGDVGRSAYFTSANAELVGFAKAHKAMYKLERYAPIEDTYFISAEGTNG